MVSKTEFNEELLIELEEILDLSKEFSDRKKVPIIFDGKQYTIKIPKRIAEKAEIGEDEFEFTVTSRLLEGKRKSEITGKVVRR